MNKSLSYAFLAIAFVVVGAGVASAQKKAEGSSVQCRDGDMFWNDGKLVNHCEIRETTMASGGAVNVDAGRNGGVSIKGWDRNEILVRSKIQAAAPSSGEAEQLAREVRIETSSSRIRAEGPDNRDNFYWSVSYEVFVPRRFDVSLEAHNGGISVADVHGKIEFKTLNGGVSLHRVGGDVRGTTTNGGVNVELSGSRWDGETLDVKTTNGGVNLILPDDYSAHLETGTTNGNTSFDFPVNVPLTDRGRMPKDVTLDLGSGGPTIRAITTNGGVRVRRASATRGTSL